MKSILLYRDLGKDALGKGTRIQKILEIKSRNDIVLAKFDKDYDKILDSAENNMQKEFASLG